MIGMQPSCPIPFDGTVCQPCNASYYKRGSPLLPISELGEPGVAGRGPVTEEVEKPTEEDMLDADDTDDQDTDEVIEDDDEAADDSSDDDSEE